MQAIYPLKDAQPCLPAVFRFLQYYCFFGIFGMLHPTPLACERALVASSWFFMDSMSATLFEASEFAIESTSRSEIDIRSVSSVDELEGRCRNSVAATCMC